MTRIAAIGFDLDMTLVDSRPASQRALERMVLDDAAQLNVDALMASYGLPLSRWLPAQADGARFRVLQSEAIALVEPMPGAHDALASAREAAARLVVVTSAPLAIAAGMLEAAGLRIDRLRANVWGTGKVRPICEEQCWAFVGDHAEDMLAAREAVAIAIGVNSGTSPPLGAQVVLEDLSEFRAWLSGRDAEPGSRL